MTSSHPRPSRIRKRILREHDALRATLEELSQTIATKDFDAARVTALSRQLGEQLRAHVDHEDALLLPALREADAWGQVRADQLAQHHAQQRAALGEDQLDTQLRAPRAELATWLRGVIDDLRTDMEHEERELLSVELLRDDPLGIDVEDG